MRNMFSLGTGAFESSGPQALRYLLSGWSGGTPRSSPQKKYIEDHGTVSRNGSSASIESIFRGVEPPDSATVKRPEPIVYWSASRAKRRAGFSASSSESP